MVAALAFCHLLVAAAVIVGAGRRWPVWVGAAVVVAFSVAPLGAWIPAGWITPLREGFTDDHLRRLIGQGTHAGPLLREFWVPLLYPRPPGLDGLVAFNLVLWVATAGLAVVSLRRWVGGAAAAALVAAGWLHPAAWSVALSETEAPLAWLYLILGARFAVERGGWGIAGLVGVTGVLSALRVELALVPGLMLAARLGQRVGFVARTAAWWERRVTAGWAWCRARPVRAVGGLAVLLAAWWGLAEQALPAPTVDVRVLGSVTWGLLALDPLQIRVLTLVPVALALWPAGLVLLAARGLGQSVARPLATGAAGIALLVLFNTWSLAGHGPLHGHARAVSPWELLRYVELGMPIVVGLAAYGLRGARGRRFWLLACLLPPIPPLVRLIGPAHLDRPGGTSWPLTGLVDQDSQWEQRWLLEFSRSNPGCSILTRAIPWSGAGVGRPARWVALVPGERGPSLRVYDGEDGPWTVATGLLVPGRCAVLYRSLDSQVGGMGTADPGLEVIREATRAHRPFVHPEHGSVWEGEVTLGFYALPGWPSP